MRNFFRADSEASSDFCAGSESVDKSSDDRFLPYTRQRSERNSHCVRGTGGDGERRSREVKRKASLSRRFADWDGPRIVVLPRAV